MPPRLASFFARYIDTDCPDPDEFTFQPSMVWGHDYQLLTYGSPGLSSYSPKRGAPRFDLRIVGRRPGCRPQAHHSGHLLTASPNEGFLRFHFICAIGMRITAQRNADQLDIRQSSRIYPADDDILHTFIRASLSSFKNGSMISGKESE